MARLVATAALIGTVCGGGMFAAAASLAQNQNQKERQSWTSLQMPGQLDKIPVLNSNSPEVVTTPGILVSTTPEQLNFPLPGRFDVFLHHISRAVDDKSPVLYVGVLLHNPGSHSVSVDVLQAASYLSQPDAPFVAREALIEDPDGSVFAGPGDRVTTEFLHGKTQAGWPNKLVVPPHGMAVLTSLPIPVAGLTPPLNGRTLLARLNAHGNVYASTAATFASGAPPTLADWCAVMKAGKLAGEREKPPSDPNASGPIIYGRVSGVAIGSNWNTRAAIPFATENQTFSVPIATVAGATLGTNQIQSAPLAVREPDTAYAAHGNYAVQYNLKFDVRNRAAVPLNVAYRLTSPVKKNALVTDIASVENANARVHFRGELKFEWNDGGKKMTKFVHVVQHVGDMSEPLFQLRLLPGAQKTVTVTFLYPPDATPPQALLISSSPI